MSLTPPVIGTFVALLLGVVLAFGGWDDLGLVALIGALGFLAGKVYQGDIDLTQYLGGGDRRSGR